MVRRLPIDQMAKVAIGVRDPGVLGVQSDIAAHVPYRCSKVNPFSLKIGRFLSLLGPFVPIPASPSVPGRTCLQNNSLFHYQQRCLSLLPCQYQYRYLLVFSIIPVVETD
jgi:hypothetical protein